MPHASRAAVAILLSLAAPAPAADVDFARDVLPILSDNCFHCHGPDAKARKADLRLDVKDEALRKESPVVVPGKSGASELIRRLTTDDATERMPPPKGNKKLTPAQIATLTKWVDQGAPWGKHWAFVPPQRPAVPATRDPRSATRNPIDNFVFAKLQKEGLRPSPEADKERLIRRVTLDLTGLPPTPAEVDAFHADTSADAYEKVVDRLLASPRYGERMAWEWLDAARYADSNGYQGDSERTMWPWRDWVVRALNDNMPFDRFTVEQLAGDLLPNPTKDQILATAFNRNHMINGEGGRIAEENRIEYGFDQTETAATVWLGLTFTCCRCHDHKFDPLTRTDYYRLFAYFDRTPVTGGASGGGRSGAVPPVLDFGTPEMEKKLAAAQKAYGDLAAKIAPIEKRLRDAAAGTDAKGQYTSSLPAVVESGLRKGAGGRVDSNNDDIIRHFRDTEPAYVKQLAELRKLAKARDAATNAIPKVMVMEDAKKPRDTYVLTRGAYDKRETKVTPGTPAVFPGAEKTGTGNRLELANWLVAADNPLTARVTVNRAWQTFFGNGFVKTAEDFGVQSERPSHPELLDWLACEFMDPANPERQRGGGADRNPLAGARGSPGKWDVKYLHRLIVTSATYRQSSRLTPELRERDPDNRLLARGPRLRLPSWMLRDQALAASGLLNEARGGPSVKPYQPAGVWEEATFGFKKYTPDTGDALYRRSLYVFWRRIVGPTMFFDVSSRQFCTVKTATTNTPLHALTTLNDTTYVEAARVLAQKALEAEKRDADRLAFAFRRVTARTPTAGESKILADTLAEQRRLFAADKPAAAKLLKVGDSPRDEKLDPVEHAAFTAVCSLLLNLDETLTKQ